MLQIMQGDSLKIPISISLRGTKVIPSMVSTVEIMVDELCKTYPKEVSYDEVNEVWLFPITQSETLALCPSDQPIQIRVKFSDDSVIGVGDMCLRVVASKSKEVL